MYVWFLGFRLFAASTNADILKPQHEIFFPIFFPSMENNIRLFLYRMSTNYSKQNISKDFGKMESVERSHGKAVVQIQNELLCGFQICIWIWKCSEFYTFSWFWDFAIFYGILWKWRWKDLLILLSWLWRIPAAFKNWF